MKRERERPSLKRARESQIHFGIVYYEYIYICFFIYFTYISHVCIEMNRYVMVKLIKKINYLT